MMVAVKRQVGMGTIFEFTIRVWNVFDYIYRFQLRIVRQIIVVSTTMVSIASLNAT
jgi:hypothetical protein